MLRCSGKMVLPTGQDESLSGISAGPNGTAVSAWNRLKRVCVNAGVTPKGIHSLRHAAGTRVVHETGSLEEAARHLGHASIETTRVYATWSNTKLKATVGEW